MNTFEIDNFATRNQILSKYYIGCFAADELPMRTIPKKDLPCAMVVNLCNSSINSMLCHWTGIYLSKNNTISYFDSSSLPSHKTNKYIKKFISLQRRKKVEINNQQTQSFESILCGKFVLCFLYFKAKKKSMKTYIKFFSKNNLRKNDEIVEKIFSNVFGK